LRLRRPDSGQRTHQVGEGSRQDIRRNRNRGRKSHHVLCGPHSHTSTTRISPTSGISSRISLSAHKLRAFMPHQWSRPPKDFTTSTLLASSSSINSTYPSASSSSRGLMVARARSMFSFNVIAPSPQSATLPGADMIPRKKGLGEAQTGAERATIYRRDTKAPKGRQGTVSGLSQSAQKR